MRPLRIALTKGRLEKKATDIFEKIGIDCTAFATKGRKLILPLGDDKEAVLAKAADVITYVENGVCDIGIVGKDTIMEMGGSFYEVLDLGVGQCRFALAAPQNSHFWEGYTTRRIATKYPNVARTFFAEKGMDVDIVRIEGSVELAPLLGLCHAIVDIVETGDTLRENGLEVLEDIACVSARLIVNVASLKLNKKSIEAFISAIETAKEASQ